MTRCVLRRLTGAFVVPAILAFSSTGTLAQDPRSNVGPSDRPKVDPAAVTRGTRLWNAECVTCHGPRARGGTGGSSLLRSAVVYEDRNGSRLGPFFKAGHPMQSGRNSEVLTPAEINDLLHFVLQQRNDTLRGSAPFNVKDILTGNATAGAEYFNTVGGCTKCHSVTGDLAGIGSRLTAPVDVQQRMVFPTGRGAGRGRGAAPGGGPPPPSRTAVTVTLTPATGEPMSGVLVEMDDFFVTYRNASGQIQVVRRTPSLRVVVNDPLQAHRDLLNRLTDNAMHDLTAYLWSLK